MGKQGITGNEIDSEVLFANACLLSRKPKNTSIKALGFARFCSDLALAHLLKCTPLQRSFDAILASFFEPQEITVMSNLDRKFFGETEAFEAEQFEWQGEGEWGSEAEAEVFNEAEVMELAGELLEVTNEQELDHFLGDLIKRAGSALGQAVRSPVGQAIGSMLKGVAAKALPLAGTALGGMVGGPLGASIGGGLANAAGHALGLEAEMEAEDREFEGAKSFVKMAGDTVKSTLNNDSASTPLAAVKAALAQAAQKHAPALLAPVNTTVMKPKGGGERVGRWVRQGRNIIIVNCPPSHN